MYTRHDHLIDSKVVQESPWPVQAINWPQGRRLVDYLNFLLVPLPFKALSEEPKLPELVSLLALAWQANQPLLATISNDLIARINPHNKPIVVDLGLGDGNALAEMKQQQDLITIGIGLHQIIPANAPYIDLLCYSPVAHGVQARKLFDELRGGVNLVCEVYGPSTYADGLSNPIESLIYAGLLLAPGGRARIIASSVFGEDKDQSPFGFATQRLRLKTFFKECLGLDLIISRTYIRSAVQKGTHCADFHLEIRRASNALVSKDSLDVLFTKAREFIGVCEVLPRRSPFGDFGTFSISGRTYTRKGETTQYQPLDYLQGIAARTYRFTGPQDMHPSFIFEFTSEEMKEDFITRFNEYYPCSFYKSDWFLSRSRDNAVTLNYTAAAENRMAAMRQAKLELERAFPRIVSAAVAQSGLSLYKSNQAVSSCDMSTRANPAFTAF